jgi:hypothetical protein
VWSVVGAGAAQSAAGRPTPAGIVCAARATGHQAAAVNTPQVRIISNMIDAFVQRITRVSTMGSAVEHRDRIRAAGTPSRQIASDGSNEQQRGRPKLGVDYSNGTAPLSNYW